MKEFNNYLSCELYKMNRKKTLLILAIVIVAIILIIMGISLLVNGLLDGAGVASVNDNYKEQILLLQTQLQIVEEQMSSSKLYKLLYFNQAYQIKSQISMYEYYLQNDTPAGACTTYNIGNSLTDIFAGNYYSFVSLCMATMMTVILCYMIVMACRNTVGEYNSGTMKMQLMRPVNKQKFYTAKWLSVFIMSECVLLFSMLVAFVAGVVAFGGISPDVLLIVNASKVTRVSPLTALFISFILKSIKIFVLLQLTMFINSLCRKNSLALTLNIVLTLVEVGVLIETVASLPYVGFAGFYLNLNWESALTLTGPSLRGMTLWSMIPFTFVWTALFMVLSYRNFARKEL